MTEHGTSLKEIEKSIELGEEGMYSCPLNWAQVMWLVEEVGRYETLIKVIHELAWEHLDEPSPDGGEIPAIHALTKEIMQ